MGRQRVVATSDAQATYDQQHREKECGRAQLRLADAAARTQGQALVKY